MIFNALTNLGIRTQLDGTLEIVEDDFSAAIKDNFDEIGALFSPRSSASSSYVEVGYGSYVDRATAGTYTVDITTEPSKGTITGDANVAVFPDLNTGTGKDYSFTISVDGTESNSITLPDNADYADGDAMAAELQTLINGDSFLKAAGAAVDVVYNSSDDQFEFTSRQYGSVSTVSFTAGGRRYGGSGH